MNYADLFKTTASSFALVGMPLVAFDKLEPLRFLFWLGLLCLAWGAVKLYRLGNPPA